MNTISRHGMCGLLVLWTGTVVLSAQPAPVHVLSAPQPAPVGSATPINAPASVQSATTSVGPRIQFATKDPNFGRVRRGELVKYTYNFTNTGCDVLHVLAVQPGCGCTHAGEWTKAVEPGKSGVIPIQLNTANFQGDVTKFVTVTTDDKSIPNGIVQLLLKGNIWSPIEVNPQFLNFMVPPDAGQGFGTVVITNNTEDPLYVFEPQCSNPAFKVEVKTNTPGRGYQLTISRVPPLTPGVAQASVTLKTSWTNPPMVAVTAWANVLAPVTVLPTQLTLLQPPLSNPAPYTITIQNATTNQMELSEPAVSLQDVKVELKEIIPGRYFNALLTFPLGFEIPRGQKVEFTAKTGMPKNPLITVPIVQLPKPVQLTPALVKPVQLTPASAPQPVRVVPAPPPPRADAR